MPRRNEIKIVLLGDSNVGKSSLFMRLLNKPFNPNQDMTMGAAFSTIKMVRDPKTNTLQFGGHGESWTISIWDTAGQERYKALLPMYYRNADIAFLVHDNSPSSVDVVRTTLKSLQEKSFRGTLCLVQNKCDLPSHVYNHELVNEINPDMSGTTSAKTGEHVRSLFCDTLNVAVGKRLTWSELEPPGVTDDSVQLETDTRWDYYNRCC